MPAASLATNRHEADSGTPTARAEAGFDLAVPADAGLAARLKQATAPAHRVAESSGIIRRLIERRASREDYLLYLRNLHPLYAALEARLARLRNAAGFDPIADPALARRDAIESDLAALAGDDWRRHLCAPHWRDFRSQAGRACLRALSRRP